jgi:pentatricopeptide repeat protein
LLSVFLAHSAADAPFAEELSAFLEAGCDAVSLARDGLIKPGQDLLRAAETGQSADILILLLSPASNPPRWPRERWEPLFARNQEADTRSAVFLLEECVFPALLRRGLSFFDATADRLPAMRRLKRWLLGIRLGASPAMTFSPDLELLYSALADKPGTLTASGAMAGRFAHQAARDFEAVLWIPAHGRTLAQIAGELGSRLQMTLDGPLEDNCRRIRDVLSSQRCLLILDAPQVPVDPLLPSGRTSVLFTSEPVHIVADVRSLAVARSLVTARRFAEADEIFRELLNSGVEPQSCARELVWICEHWDRIEEANDLRFLTGPSPAEQLRLF